MKYSKRSMQSHMNGFTGPIIQYNEDSGNVVAEVIVSEVDTEVIMSREKYVMKRTHQRNILTYKF